MAKQKFTFADAKKKIKELEMALEDEQQRVADLLNELGARVTKKDYYQGAALGAVVTAAIFTALILIF